MQTKLFQTHACAHTHTKQQQHKMHRWEADSRCVLTDCLVRVVLQACLCSRCLPLQAVTRDEVQSVLKSRMQDQASEQSSNIKAHKPTSTPPPEQERTLLC